MDINTIFYFPSSLTFEEYSNKLDQGEISERTIVFADAQKAIYKGGKKYGGTSVQEFHNLIDTLYDDSWISDEINGIKSDVLQSIARLDLFNTLVTNVSSRLDTEIQERDNNIQANIEELMEDTAWLQENFPQGVTQWDAGWNQNLEAYLQTVGYWTTDGNNQTITQWSKLRQDLNSIETSVNSLKVDGNLTQALTTSIQLLITDKIASLQLGTTYATVERVGDVEKVLEWMYSGFESSASEDITFSEMSSMAKNDFVSAISDIRTQVSKVANGDFVAQTELESKVGDTITTMLLQSSSDNALAGMSARLDTVELQSDTTTKNIADLILGVTGSSSTADISTAVSDVLSGFAASSDVTDNITSAKSEIYSAIGAKDINDNFISIASLKTLVDGYTSQISGLASTEDVSAGFVAKTDLDSAVATLVAQNGSSVKANIEAAVSNGISSVTITADQINLNGLVTALNARIDDLQVTLLAYGTSDDDICVKISANGLDLANKSWMEYRTGGQYINMLPDRICMGRVGRYISSLVVISNGSSNNSGFGSTDDSGFVGIKVVGSPEGDTANMLNTLQLTAQFGVDGIRYGYPYGMSMHSFDVSAKRSGDVFICTVSSYYARFYRAHVEDLYITTGLDFTDTYKLDVSAAVAAGILVAV